MALQMQTKFPPQIFPRSVQLLPMESFLAQYYGKQLLKRFNGNFSVKIGERIKDTKKLSDHSLVVSTVQSTRNKLQLSFNGFKENEERSHREIFESFLSEYPETEELCVREMTEKHAIPSKLASRIPSNEVYIQYRKYGHFTNLLQQLGIVNIYNPYQIIKRELIKLGLWEKKWQYRLRGVCASGLPFTNEGTITKGEKMLLELNASLIPNYLTVDIATPRIRKISNGYGPLPISTYDLLNREKPIAIGWSDVIY